MLIKIDSKSYYSQEFARSILLENNMAYFLNEQNKFTTRIRQIRLGTTFAFTPIKLAPSSSFLISIHSKRT